jgi:hypothetical protein
LYQQLQVIVFYGREASVYREILLKDDSRCGAYYFFVLGERPNDFM